MLKECGSRRVSLSRIEVSRYLSPKVRRVLLARTPFLQELQDMTDEALKAYLMQHPPVVYEAKRGEHGDPLFCLANLNALYIAKNRLRNSEKVRVTLVEAPLSQQTNVAALFFALSAEACHALSPNDAGHYLAALWNELMAAQPALLMDVSERFSNKTTFCDAFGLNRRLY